MKKKKLLAFTVVAATFISSAQVLAANFTDVNNVPWEGAKTYINSVADTGIMIGDHNDKGYLVFRAKDGVSYCETMQLIYSLIQKTTGNNVPSDVQNKWISTMNEHKIPTWVQPAVAYGLENNIIYISDLSGFVDSKGSASIEATRQDVAVMFGQALQSYGSLKSTPTLTYNDSSSIDSEAVPYVDLLSTLDIISGDNLGNFNPKNSINRAEMAVIVSKSYELMNTSQSKSITGKITSVKTINSVTAITVSSGSESVSLTGFDSVPVIDPGSNKVSISGIVEGDEVVVTYVGESIQSVLITSTESVPSDLPNIEQYPDITGTFRSVSNDSIKIKIDGSTETYYFIDEDYKEVIFYVEGEKGKFSAFKDEATVSKMVTLSFDPNGKVVKVKLANMQIGKFESITDSQIKLKINDDIETFSFADDNKLRVEFYYKDKKESFEYIKSNAEKNDDVAVYFDVDDRVFKVSIGNTSTASEYSVEGKVEGIGDTYIRIGKSNYYFYGDGIKNVAVSIIDGDKTITSLYSSSGGEEKRKEFYVSLALNDNNKVTRITGYVSKVYGDLTKVLPLSGVLQVATGKHESMILSYGNNGYYSSNNSYNEPVEARYYSTSSTTFDLEDVEGNYPDSIEGLVQAFKGHEDAWLGYLQVTLELDSNGFVTSVKAEDL